MHFKGLKNYTWIIPYYHLVIYKTNGASIHAQGKYIRFRNNQTFKENSSQGTTEKKSPQSAAPAGIFTTFAKVDNQPENEDEMNPEIEDFKILKKDIIERNGIKVYKEEGEGNEDE